MQKKEGTSIKIKKLEPLYIINNNNSLFSEKKKMKMSGSTELVEKVGRLPEKSTSFSQTCSLLSQYLKERGSFGDLSLGMACNIESNGNGPSEMLRHSTTMMNLFPVSEKPGYVPCQNIGTCWNVLSMDLFPQQAGFAPKEEDVQKKLDSRCSVKKSASAEPETAQMTIFYAGQVIAFNDFPADKAKEVMLLASKGSSQSQSSVAATVSTTPIESNSSVPCRASGNKLMQECMQPVAQQIPNDLPIARRASLHRFLEKRKNRVTARAPYQINNPASATTTSEAVESKSWLGLAAQST